MSLVGGTAVGSGFSVEECGRRGVFSEARSCSPVCGARDAARVVVKQERTEVGSVLSQPMLAVFAR